MQHSAMSKCQLNFGYKKRVLYFERELKRNCIHVQSALEVQRAHQSPTKLVICDRVKMLSDITNFEIIAFEMIYPIEVAKICQNSQKETLPE